MWGKYSHTKNNIIVHVYIDLAMVWLFRCLAVLDEEHKLRLNGGHIKGRAQISLKVYRGEHVS